MGHFHPAVFLKSPVFSGFSSHYGVAHGCIFAGRVLEMADFLCRLFGYDRIAILLYHSHFCVWPPVFILDGRQGADAQGLVDKLDALVLQRGNGHGWHIDADRSEKQKQGNAVKPANGHIAPSGNIGVLVKLPGDFFGIGLFWGVGPLLLDDEVLGLLVGVILHHPVIHGFHW